MTPMQGALPLSAAFSFSFSQGTLLAVAWNDGTISFVTHTFLTDEEVRERFM